MKGYDHFIRLLILVGLMLAGLLITGGLTLLLLIVSGMDMNDATSILQSGMTEVPAWVIRGSVIIQHISFFIIPALAFGYLVYRSDKWRELRLSRFPTLWLVLLGVLFLAALYPLVTLSALLNEAIYLPSWTSALEDQAMETMRQILEVESPWVYVVNFFLIAIIPGIGEELIFRGIVQKHLGGWLKNPIVGIWVAALIFSAFHMQFEGFFPRLVLGLGLGYLYHWSKNLWVPIIVHAANNGITLAILYATDTDLAEIDTQGGSELKWWIILSAIVFMYYLHLAIKKNRTVIEK